MTVVCITGVGIVGVGAAVDTAPPAVLVLPSEGVGSDGALTVRVRVIDSSGAGEITLWVRSVEDPEFHPMRMAPVGGDEFAAAVPQALTRGTRVLYYVEARDELGNGPAFGGNPRTPFAVAIDRSAVEASAVEAAASSWVARGLIGASCLVALILALRLHRRVRREQLAREVAEDLGRLAVQMMPGTASRTAASSGSRTSVDVPTSEEARRFWARILEPLRTLDALERDRQLAILAARPHQHPTLGKQFFSRQALGRHLSWVLEQPPELPSEVHAPLPPPDASTHSTQRLDAGATLVELLVVVGLLAVAVAIVVVSFEAMATPLRSGGEMVRGALRQTRARAIATTTPHRLRPVSSTTLVVESAGSCSAGPWTLEPRSELVLPHGVSLADTAWSVCYGSRGVAEQSRTITLAHADGESRQLEVLLGGAVSFNP